MATTFADRLAAALEFKKCTRADLARVLRSPKGTLGVSESAIGQLLDGKFSFRKPRAEGMLSITRD